MPRPLLLLHLQLKRKNLGCCFSEPSTDCLTIRLDIKNIKFDYLTGSYPKATNMNGKPSWKTEKYAIWYNTQSGNRWWRIGSIEEIGSDYSWIKASNDFSGIFDKDNQWVYFNGNVWVKPSNPNTIQVTCLNGKNGKFQH